MYAVVFKDADTTGDTEDDADLFFKVITPEVSDESNELVREFSIGTGNYQICFVANPSEDLLGGIEGLTAGSSNVANFKKLVEKKSPDTKPGMLMTSGFHKVSVETNKENDLGTVTLERAMARIDIVNLADGITISSVKFVNRATESVLISDATTTENAAFKDTTYTDMNLAGSSGGSAAYKAKIYSYEQYGTDDNAPSLVVNYTIGDKNYTHTIAFVTKGDGDTETQINLKRNHLYTVNISNNAGKLTFTLSVADWNKGTEFEVTSSELLARMIDYTDIKVGDIMLKDGSYVSMSGVSTLTDEQRAKAIGVVAYVGTHFKSGVKSAISNPHGLVLALKDASSDIKYMSLDGTTTNVTLGSDNQSTSIKDLYDTKMDGYAAYTKAMATTAPHSRIFDQATTYNTNNKTPENTTGWYIPSIGEWIDIFGCDGIGKSSNVSGLKSNTGNDKSVSDVATITSNINTALAKVGGSGYYGTFGSDKFEYWSSSEKDANNAYIVYKNTSTSLIIADPWNKTSSVHSGLRCILAF